MADFKIKPTAGTGNKLILESEDGTDVLTTSDSGVTLASATLNSPTLVTPALGTPASGVVTNLSGVLPVGVTGGSGLTALGTVASGTLSSGVTFPGEQNSSGGGGHVLQVVSTTKTDSWAVSSTGSHAVTGLSVAITPRNTSNKILVQAHFCGRIGDYGGGYNIFRNGSMIISPTDYGDRTPTHVSAWNGEANVTVQLSAQMLDSSLPSGVLTYQVYVMARSNSTYYVNRSSDDTNTGDRPRTIATITAMEVEV